MSRKGWKSPGKFLWIFCSHRVTMIPDEFASQFSLSKHETITSFSDRSRRPVGQVSEIPHVATIASSASSPSASHLTITEVDPGLAGCQCNKLVSKDTHRPAVNAATHQFHVVRTSDAQNQCSHLTFTQRMNTLFFFAFSL